MHAKLLGVTCFCAREIFSSKKINRLEIVLIALIYILLYYSLEFLTNASTIVFTLAKLNQSTKYMLKVAKEILAR